jgi:hypothetical protein
MLAPSIWTEANMRQIWLPTIFIAGLALAAAPAAAQQRQTSPAQPSVMEDDQSDQAAPPAPPAKPSRRVHTAAPATPSNPDLDTDDQLAPSQMKQPMPGAVSEPSGAAGKPAHPATHAAAEPRPAALISSRTVACSGPFAKDSGMLALAMAFDSRNVIFNEIDVGGSKVGTSVVFPKDPKRRLEVWWQNPNRTGTYLILINGQSTWTAPGGMRLGLTLAQLEKLNHKPFKLKGFDKDGTATVSDWDGGALATLPGGCKSGLSLRADPKAAADAVSALSADKEYGSTDSEIRAVKPTVSEILIGY